MTHIGRIKVIKETEELMDNICVCPHCGRHVLYGNMLMYNGIHSCPTCHQRLCYEVEHDKSYDYDSYVQKANNHEYEPYKYVEIE